MVVPGTRAITTLPVARQSAHCKRAHHLEKVSPLEEHLPIGRKSTHWKEVCPWEESLSIVRKSTHWKKLYQLEESLPVGGKSAHCKKVHPLEKSPPTGRKYHACALGPELGPAWDKGPGQGPARGPGPRAGQGPGQGPGHDTAQHDGDPFTIAPRNDVRGQRFGGVFLRIICDCMHVPLPRNPASADRSEGYKYIKMLYPNMIRT